MASTPEDRLAAIGESLDAETNQAELSTWEIDFLEGASIRAAENTLTDGQLSKLDEIYRKITGDT